MFPGTAPSRTYSGRAGSCGGRLLLLLLLLSCSCRRRRHRRRHCASSSATATSTTTTSPSSSSVHLLPQAPHQPLVLVPQPRRVARLGPLHSTPQPPNVPRRGLERRRAQGHRQRLDADVVDVVRLVEHDDTLALEVAGDHLGDLRVQHVLVVVDCKMFKMIFFVFEIAGKVSEKKEKGFLLFFVYCAAFLFSSSFSPSKTKNTQQNEKEKTNKQKELTDDVGEGEHVSGQKVGAPFLPPADGAEVGQSVDPGVEHRAPPGSLEPFVPGAEGRVGGAASAIAVAVAIASDVLDGGRGRSCSCCCCSCSSSSPFSAGAAASTAAAASSGPSSPLAAAAPRPTLCPLPHPRRRQPAALGVGGLAARLVGDVGVDAEVLARREAEREDLRRRAAVVVLVLARRRDGCCLSRCCCCCFCFCCSSSVFLLRGRRTEIPSPVSDQLAQLHEHLLHLRDRARAVDELADLRVRELVGGDEGEEGDCLARARGHLLFLLFFVRESVCVRAREGWGLGDGEGGGGGG